MAGSLKIFPHILPQRQPDNGLIIIGPEPAAHHLRKACGPGTAGNLHNIYLSILVNSVTVHRTVVQPQRPDGFFRLLPGLCSQRFLTGKGHRMADGTGRGPLERLGIVGKQKQDFSAIHHSLDAKQRPLDKFLHQAVVFTGSCHGLLIIFQCFLPCIRAENPPAAHKIHCLYDHRKTQLVKGLLQLPAVSDTDPWSGLHPRPGKRLLHQQLVGSPHGRLTAGSAKAQLLTDRPDGPHTEIQPAGGHTVRFPPKSRPHHRIRIGKIRDQPLIRLIKSRIISLNTHRSHPASQPFRRLDQWNLGISGAHHHKPFPVFSHYVLL